QFEAAHQLSAEFGPAARLHGHTYTLEVVVRGPAIQANGTLYDVGDLRAMVNDLAAALHYRVLSEIPALAKANTTAEVVASYCWETLAARLRGSNLDSLLVRVWENPQTFAARDDAL
ncbi:MAG TPA: 6-carboxytetrahydropterin synthase, partial [Ktedonobacterales bacterium]|nr:6-carboxytetrahydropterin synthase [Ktedonobacterales bacterium]